MEVFVLS